MKKVWIETTEFFSQEQRQVSPQGSIHLSHGQTWDLCCIVHALPLKTPTILATFFVLLAIFVSFSHPWVLKHPFSPRCRDNAVCCGCLARGIEYLFPGQGG